MIAEDGFVAIFEQTTRTSVDMVMVLSIPCEELTHHRGDSLPAAFKKEVKVVVQKDPGIDRTFLFDHVLAEAIEVTHFILVVAEDRLFIDFPP